jgi:AMP nucleosidase
MINIGTGPSNARNITDHVAVLRPHAWLMLGHCAGLGHSQKLGDYVLAHGYLREDQVLDEELPLWAPIPALAEVQVALEQAVGEVTGLTGFEAKRVMRTGTVVSVDNRNWELGDHMATVRRLSQSRAIALDMESATRAAALAQAAQLLRSRVSVNGASRLCVSASCLIRSSIAACACAGVIALVQGRLSTSLSHSALFDRVRSSPKL